MIFPISTEQKVVINNLKNNNVIVNAVAGSGKTTTTIFIALENIKDNILLLTYNANLKVETRNRIDENNISNTEVHSYHSFGVKYYNRSCFTDKEIKNVIYSNSTPLKKINYDIIIIDEAQDITAVYYEFICKIFVDNINENTRICIFGDEKQSIFDFNGADSRYISFGETLFNFNNYNWIRNTLSTSYRITDEMSGFINECLVGYNYIKTVRSAGFKPRYLITKTYCDSQNSLVFNELVYYLNLGVKPDEIFIIAPSVNSEKSPVKMFENQIKNRFPEINIYVASKDGSTDKSLLQNKLVITTIHQSKGLERKVVILFNFDNSYMLYYKKNCNPLILPNELYVASTRAKERLSVIHGIDQKYLPFLNQTRLKDNVVFKGQDLIQKEEKPMEKKDIGVRDLISHIKDELIDQLLNKSVIIKNTDFKTTTVIDIPNKFHNISTDTYEDVSNVNGVCIIMYFEANHKIINNFNNYKNSQLEQMKMTNFKNRIDDTTTKLLNRTKTISKIDENIHKKYNLNNINPHDLLIDEFLYISNCYCAYVDNFIFKVLQIDNYDWISKDNMDECLNRLSKLNLSANSVFEYTIRDKTPKYNRIITGTIDCYDEKNNIIYEFKCVQNLTNEHFLQLLIYMYLHKHNEPENTTAKYVLFNIYTNEYYEIKCGIDELNELIADIFDEKYGDKKPLDDTTFLKNNNEIRLKYFDD